MLPSSIKRFDRIGDQRIPFVSASSMLAGFTEAGSYTLIADAIRQFGAEIEADLRELWSRMLFSLLVSNCDDHLRNHGFLMHRQGRWSLAPAFDINPVPDFERRSMNQTSFCEEPVEPSVDLALALAQRFGLKEKTALEILRKIYKSASEWRDTGRKLRLQSGTLDAYASAFENPWMDEARKILGH